MPTKRRPRLHKNQLSLRRLSSFDGRQKIKGGLVVFSGFDLRGGLGTRRVGYSCRLGQRGEPGGHGRLGAGQRSANGLTWEQQRWRTTKTLLTKQVLPDIYWLNHDAFRLFLAVSDQPQTILFTNMDLELWRSVIWLFSVTRPSLALENRKGSEKKRYKLLRVLFVFEGNAGKAGFGLFDLSWHIVSFYNVNIIVLGPQTFVTCDDLLLFYQQKS